MLETEDIEEDYFTPASSTSLANIFGKSNIEHKTENESLKYTPPKPQSTSPKSEELKATQCVMACALYGYEWVDNVFTSKGMLGFAILKVIRTGQHNIVLYDSNKKTLSCASITSALNVTVKGNINISYYDNIQKYWSIHCKQEEGKKIIEIFQNLNAVIKYSSDTENEPSKERERQTLQTSSKTEQSIQTDKESDTDSSINRRTKMSILSRMASMGHSVLPPHTLSSEKTSDSSDTNDTDNYPKTIRHKFVKGAIKRNNSEKNDFDIQSLSETHNKMSRTEQSIENTPTLYTNVGGQLVPVTNTNITTASSSSTNEMNMFMSEQRVSNSEVRINISRMTDKIDTIFNKLTDITNKDINIISNDFQTEILKKLLGEYENKIKSYEEIIKTKVIDKPSNIALIHESNIAESPRAHNTMANEDTVTLNSKISELQQSNKEKENRINKLESEMNKLHEKLIDIKKNYDASLDMNRKFEQKIDSQNEELIKVTEKLKISTEENSKSLNIMKDNIKNIMNKTFHAIAANFDNDKSYTGVGIKNIVATVIKKMVTSPINAVNSRSMARATTQGGPPAVPTAQVEQKKICDSV